MKKLRKCSECGTYTLLEACPRCGGDATSPHPARFSPDDPYGRYRRQRKKEVMVEHGDPPERA